MSRVFDLLGRGVTGRGLWIIIAFLCLSLLSAFTLKGFPIETDLLKLLPPGSESIRAFKDAVSTFGSVEYLFITVTAERGASRKTIIPFSREFKRELISTGLFTKVEERIPRSLIEEFSGFLLSNFPLLLSDEDRGPLMERFEEGSLSREIRNWKRFLLLPVPSSNIPGYREDPLKIAPLFLPGYLKGGGGGFTFSDPEGFFFSRDGRSLMILCQPISPPQKLEFDELLIGKVEELREKVKRDNPDFRELKVEFFGPYMNAVHDSRIIKQSIYPTFLPAFFTVLLLFYLVFRRVTPMFLIGFSLISGIVLTFGISKGVVGHLNIISIGFAAMLVGLGIDYGVHIYNYYQIDLWKGAGRGDALIGAFHHTGGAILIAALTTAIVFFSLTITDFTGIREMGIISGIGILTIFITMCFLFPSLVFEIERGKGWAGKGSKRKGPEGVLERIQRMEKWITENYRPVLIASAAITLFLLFFALKTDFDPGMLSLRAQGTELMRRYDTMMERFRGPSYRVMVILKGEEIDPLLKNGRRLEALFERYMDQGKIIHYESPFSFIPSIEDQREAMAGTGRGFYERAREDLSRAMEREGIKGDALTLLNDTLDRFSRDNFRFITLETFDRYPGIRSIMDNFIKREGGLWSIQSSLYPPKGRWEERVPGEVIEEIHGAVRGCQVEVAGVAFIFSELGRAMKGTFFRSSIISIGGVFLLLLLIFRRPLVALVTMTGMGAGVIWTLGSLSLLGIRFNFTTIMVVPLLIGIGVDHSIYIMIRFLREKVEGIDLVMAKVGRGILLSTVTTLAGFGSLSFSRYRGIAGMGELAIIGISLCFISSMVLFPSLLKLGIVRRGYGSGDHEFDEGRTLDPHKPA